MELIQTNTSNMLKKVHETGVIGIPLNRAPDRIHLHALEGENTVDPGFHLNFEQGKS